jgi:hypothetical protein
MKDDIRLPRLDSRELSGRRWLFAAQHVDRAGQFGDPQFERLDLRVDLCLDLVAQIEARLSKRLAEGLD